MPNLSPGFNTRFAKIDLQTASSQPETSARALRKQYPASLYPENHHISATTTPLKAPRLSTAARAQNRAISASKMLPQTLVQLLHKRNLALALAQSKDDENKHPKHHEHALLSFMRGTLSSRKKQLASLAPPERTLQPTRSSSHSDMYTRRPHHYAALAQKKRQLIKTSVTPGDITGAGSSQKLDFADKPTIFTSHLPSRNVSRGNSPKPRQNDVHTRLYTRSKRENTPKDDQTPRPAPTTRISGRSRSETPPTARDSKPTTISDLYHGIYRADPGFFTECNLLESELVPETPMVVSELLDSDRGHHFSVYERGEIMRNANVYYAPATHKEYISSSDINISSFKNNYGFDDADGNYLIRPQDHIEYRYEIVRVLGTGSFGNVVHCRDHKYVEPEQHQVQNCRQRRWRNVAVKIIKNELDWSLQAVSEIKMLKLLMAALGSLPNRHIMNYCDHFHFRGHMCIVSELLSLNLYTLLELGSFKGLALSLVKNIASQILKGLLFVHQHKIIHSDIKPENIMIRLPLGFQPGDNNVEGFDVKLIDFGSSCADSDTSFSYIQSRFYRAPEVILGSKYSYEIDIWSFGCVVAELFTGTPLLPGKNEVEQVALVLEMFGAPPSSFIVGERKKLWRYMKQDLHRKLNPKDPLSTDTSVFQHKHQGAQVDEKKVRKTLLYTLFNLEGKVNLAFLNLQLQAMEARDSQPSAATSSSSVRRNVKISARSLDVAMRLHSSGESKIDHGNFSRFMALVLQWVPANRPSADQLLDSAFFREN